jgi:hypothetical protein
VTYDDDRSPPRLRIKVIAGEGYTYHYAVREASQLIGGLLESLRAVHRPLGGDSSFTDAMQLFKRLVERPP